MTTTLTKDAIQAEALSRAIGNQSLTNWPAIFAGLSAKGISETDIRPRENVFTYNAWRALGRQVRRGEHGVKITTFVAIKGKEDTANPDTTGKPKRRSSRPWTATVFHVSQTDPIG
jgi:hypothetical protein